MPSDSCEKRFSLTLQQMKRMPRHLRFCHFTTFYPPYGFGGDAVYVYRLANSLAARGHEVDVVHCADSYNLLSANAAKHPLPHHPGVTVHTLRSPLGPISPILSQQTGRPLLKRRKIQKILNSKQFDVIHFHITSLFGPKLLQIAPEYDGFIKLYTTHEHWLICPMHVLWKHGDRLCDSPQCFRCTLRHHRPPQWWRYTQLLQEATADIDLFISPSRFAVDMHQQRGIHGPFVRLAHFAPEPDYGAGASDYRPGFRPFFLFVGRLEKIKGLQNVIDVFVKYEHADLLIAGSGAYESELQRRADRSENIKFLGWLDSNQLNRLYRSAVALIVPSICYEVFPMVLFESFSHQTPAIVNALGALPEIIEECRGGLVYRNQEELMSSVERLQSDAELRQQLGTSAYRKWKEEWTEQAHLRRYFSIINEAATRRYGFIPWAEDAESQSTP